MQNHKLERLNNAFMEQLNIIFGTDVQTALYTLINTRLAAGRHTVISSNLSMDEVSRRYSPQIASRLAGEYHVLYFYGDDIRLVKKNRL